MSVPVPRSDDSLRSVRSGRSQRDHRRDRLLLARKWAYLVSATAYIPLPYPDVEAELLTMVDRLIDVLRVEPLDPTPALDVARRLVGMNCVGPASLQRTMDVLGRALLGQAELRAVRGLSEKVTALLGTLAAGYVDAVRQLTLRQQEDLNRTVIAVGKASRAALHSTEAQLAVVLETATTGIAVTDTDGRFVRTNPALRAILGYSTTEYERRTLFQLLPDDDEIFVRTGCAQLTEGTLRRVHQRRTMVTKAGDTIPVTITASLLREQGRADRFVFVVQDESELRLLQSQLTRQSLHDVVTGLPNRQFFTTRLETTLHRADPHTGTTVYHLDLDAFAMIADGLGRQVGDQLLKVVAERLKAVVADENAMVARLDSDEFAILVENSPTTPDVATTVNRINEELAEPVYIDGHGVTVSTSIGVVHRPRGDVDPTELLRASDLALRRAKEHGRRQWELFDAGRDEQDRARFNLATTMPSAWEMGEIQLSYRPQVTLATGAVVGLEPVLEWDHPEFGRVGHTRCVELAEQTGLMLSLGDWVLHSACAQLRRRRRESGVDLPLVIGLSEGQAVDPDLVCRVLRILDDDDVAPDRVRIGMPVRLLHGDRTEPAEHLRAFADEGIGLVLHGFGGAAADLTCLEDLPVAAVRVDEKLVTSQARRSNSLLGKALRDLVGLVHEAGGSVAVDGVHTEAQAAWWRDAGADTAIGDHFTTW